MKKSPYRPAAQFDVRDLTFRERDITVIYALGDPRDGTFRYVGQSVQPYWRSVQHVTTTKTLKEGSPKRLWLEDLKRRKLRPVVTILEEVSSGDPLERERFWTLKLLSEGAPLTNGGYFKPIRISFVPTAEVVEAVTELLSRTPELVCLGAHKHRDRVICDAILAAVAKKPKRGRKARGK